MPLPGRNFSIAAYRYGYQGSEKDDEITGVTGAHITTFFRENDTRLLRWWSVDPKATVIPWESPYVSMGGNPIWFNDPLGDIFDVADDDDSKEDVKSLADEKNRDFIRFGESVDGVSNVTLDFGDKSQKEINEILDNDKGLKLINDLVTATKPEDGSDVSFFYANSNTGKEISPSGKVIENGHYLTDDGHDFHGFVSNISMNNRLPASIPKRISSVPYGEYDGTVRISNGFFSLYDIDNDSYLKLERSSVVFHELAENYFRTIMCMPYENTDGSTGAHKSAMDLEGSSFGRDLTKDEFFPVIFIPFEL